MQISSKDGNMVVDFYPTKDANNKVYSDKILKVLSFRGDTQKKMVISRDHFYYQVREYVLTHKYRITDDAMLPQFFSSEVV
mgnify:FL=1